MPMGFRTIGSAAKSEISNPSATLNDFSSASGLFSLAVAPGALGPSARAGAAASRQKSSAVKRHRRLESVFMLFKSFGRA